MKTEKTHLVNSIHSSSIEYNIFYNISNFSFGDQAPRNEKQKYFALSEA